MKPLEKDDSALSQALSSSPGFRGDAHAPPSDAFEELEIRTADGTTLRALAWEPPSGIAVRGTCILAHALFARKTSFGSAKRPGLAGLYASRGFRVIAFDFRGHGDSAIARGAPPAGYDDFVLRDLPSVVACARDRGEGRPVVVVGHSMGGHASLASQGAGLLGADGLVTIAASVWVPDLEASPVRRVAKNVSLRLMSETARRVGLFPARALRFSSDDASERLMRDLARFAVRNAWRSEDGRYDYLGGMANVRVPVCAVASVGDRAICPPATVFALMKRCLGPVRVVSMDRSDDGGPPPGHMEIVTSPRAETTLEGALEWVVARAKPTA